jgi:hypothetical protein
MLRGRREDGKVENLLVRDGRRIAATAQSTFVVVALEPPILLL